MNEVTYKPEYVRTTPKALAVYRDVSGDRNIGQAALCVWLKSMQLRQLSGGSPYFVAEDGPLRFVFCVAEGRELSDGHFCLVNVQKRHR